MSKLFALTLAASLIGGSAATAQACGGSCCAQAASCSMPAAQAAPAQDHSQMDMSRAPQTTRRSYSYQPGTIYAPRMMRSQGRSFSGVRGADSKVLGNY